MKFSHIALLSLLPLFAVVAYFKVPSVRGRVDAGFPIRPVQAAEVNPQAIPPRAPEPVMESPVVADSSPPSEPAATPDASPGTSTEASTEAIGQVAETPPPATNTTFDLAQLSQSRKEWPKSITLRKAIDFPAVVNGQVSGKLKAPAGSKVNLVLIRNGRLGVEYCGGGALVTVSDTDLAERVLQSRAASGMGDKR